jgi:hypothetical protein
MLLDEITFTLSNTTTVQCPNLNNFRLIQYFHLCWFWKIFFLDLTTSKFTISIPSPTPHSSISYTYTQTLDKTTHGSTLYYEKDHIESEPSQKEVQSMRDSTKNLSFFQFPTVPHYLLPKCKAFQILQNISNKNQFQTCNSSSMTSSCTDRYYWIFMFTKKLHFLRCRNYGSVRCCSIS